jgi:hypothetical protein
VAYIRAHPKLFFWNTVERVFAFWSGRRSGLVYGVTLLNACGLVGLGVLWRRSHYYAVVFGLPLLVYPLPFYLTHAEVRYQHTIQPMLTVLAAFVLCSRSKVNRHRTLLPAVEAP